MKKRIVGVLFFFLLAFSFIRDVIKVSATENSIIKTNVMSDDHYVIEIDGIILDAKKSSQTAYYNYYDLEGNLIIELLDALVLNRTKAFFVSIKFHDYI